VCEQQQRPCDTEGYPDSVRPESYLWHCIASFDSKKERVARFNSLLSYVCYLLSDGAEPGMPAVYTGLIADPQARSSG
jgi:hypothetical protein